MSRGRKRAKPWSWAGYWRSDLQLVALALADVREQLAHQFWDKQGADPGKWKVNISTGEKSCPTKKKIICIFYLWRSIQNIIHHFPDYPSQSRELFFSCHPLYNSVSFLNFTSFGTIASDSLWLGCVERVKGTSSQPQKRKIIPLFDIFLFCHQIGSISPHSRPFEMMA